MVDVPYMGMSDRSVRVPLCKERSIKCMRERVQSTTHLQVWCSHHSCRESLELGAFECHVIIRFSAMTTVTDRFKVKVRFRVKVKARVWVRVSGG